MKNRAIKSILKVTPYVAGKPIEEVKRELGLKTVVKLASNENPFSPSPKVLKAIETAAKSVNRYPASDCYYLRQELAKRLKIKSEQLIFGNGSDELILFVVRAFVKAGDEVIMADPSFLIYNIASRIAGAKIKAIALNNFHYDLGAMKKAISAKTKLIFLGNPDNPNGKYFTQEEIESFLSGVRKDVLVFIDEAYFEFVQTSDYVDSKQLIKKYHNVFVTRTFSKLYGLAGLRIGYGFAHEELINILNRIREPFNVNSIAQAAALACLKDEAYYKKCRLFYSQQRRILLDAFTAMGLSAVESFTNFILLDVKRGATTVFNQLLKKGLIVRDMSRWGYKHHIRVTIGTEKENAKLIKSLKEIL